MLALDTGLATTFRRAGVEPLALLAWANDVDGPEGSAGYPPAPCGQWTVPEARQRSHGSRTRTCLSTDLEAIQWGRSGWARDQRVSAWQAALYRRGSRPRSVVEVLQDGRYADGSPLVPTMLLTSPWSPIAIGRFNGE